MDADLSDDELGEDSVLLESPLDKIDPYNIFKNSLLSKSFSAMAIRRALSLTVFPELQQEQPQYYASLTSHLSADEQTVITGVFQQADIIQQQVAASAANGTN